MGNAEERRRRTTAKDERRTTTGGDRQRQTTTNTEVFDNPFLPPMVPLTSLRIGEKRK
jgi:hypothetical protein